MKPSAHIISAALIALAFSLSAAGIAAAHTALASSDPSQGARVTAPLNDVVLTFTEDINPAFANIVVNGADGRNRVSASPQVEGPRLTAPVDRPGDGVYTVGYRVISADGHPISGSYTFTIAGSPQDTSQPSTPGAVPSSTTAAQPQPTFSEGSDTKTSILTAAAAGLTLAGVIVFWQSRKHRRRTPGNEPPPADVPASGDETDAR